MVRALLAALAVALSMPALAADLEANKKIVVDFYEKALNQKDFEAAAKYFGPRYIQHNPSVPNGPDGFKALVTFLKEKFPNSRSEIKRVIAEGDFVVLHVHAVREPGQRGRAIVDMFRARERQDRRALGRHPGRAREGRQRKYDVLGRPPHSYGEVSASYADGGVMSRCMCELMTPPSAMTRTPPPKTGEESR